MGEGSPSRTHSPWQRGLPLPDSDVVVVGGGVTGAATAYWLRRLDPTLRVTLLEAETLAFGASGRNAGFLLLGTHVDYASAVAAVGRERAWRLWRFTEDNADQVSELGGGCDLALTGSVLAAGSPEEAARLRASERMLAEDGVSASFVEGTGGDAASGGRGFHGALVIPRGGALHPVKLVRLLAATSGATVVEGWRVERLDAVAGGVRLEGDAGALEAPRVILCLNADLPRLVPDLAGAVRPVRAQMLATAPVAPVLDRPVYSHEGFYYIRQRPDGRVLVGGARHRHEAEEEGAADGTTAALQADLEAYLHRHFPAVGTPAVERRWSGLMGFSPSGLPVVGAVPGLPAALYACGFTGHGMALGVRMGLLLTRRALGQADEAADLFSGEQDASGMAPTTASAR